MTDQQHLRRTSELPAELATTDELLRSWHQDRAATIQPPAALATLVAGIPELVRVRRPLPGFGVSRRMGLLLAVGLLLLLTAAAAVIGAGLLRSRPAPLPISHHTQPAPIQSQPAPITAGILSWEEMPGNPDSLGSSVLFTGDEFMAFNLPGDGQPIVTSTDGRQWQESADISVAPSADHVAAWKGTIVSWWSAAGNVSVQHPDGSPLVRRPGSKKVAIDDAAIGPAGIVILENGIDQWQIIQQVLGPEWADVEHADTCSPACPPGVLTVTRDDGQTASISLADHGYQVPSWAGGWYSETGDTWTPIAGLPFPVVDETIPGALVAVAASPDGFFARMDDGTMWHSADGLSWRMIGSAGVNDGSPLISWRDGVLTVWADGYTYWTAAGGSTLRPDSPPEGAVNGAGPLGIVSVSRHDDRALFSPDGQSWREIALPANRAETPWIVEDTSQAVGRDAALVVLWEQGPDGTGEVPSLWRLTFE